MTEFDRSPSGATARRRAFRVAALLFLGTLLLQSAWILTLPPFRGTDEFDHAFRAAQVAGGDWAAVVQLVPDYAGLAIDAEGTRVPTADWPA